MPLNSFNSVNRYIRTDLAAECRTEAEIGRKHGIRFSTRERNGFQVDELTVEKKGEPLVGKPAGRYLTLHLGAIWMMEDSRKEEARHCLSAELSALCEQTVPGYSAVLVAGLGNRNLTVDAVGPAVCDSVTVTRHLRRENPALFDAVGQKTVSALAPGVIGQTGFESAELLSRAAALSSPDLIIAVDALAARSLSRLCTTVQLTATGICPGSGVGNARMAITRETVGAPVIAVGIPTVADSATLVYDALEQAGIEEISPALREVLERGKSYFVSVKESDLALSAMAALVSGAIDDCLSRGERPLQQQ